MTEADLDSIVQTAEQILADSLRHYDAMPRGPAYEFVEIKLQSSIFQYDVAIELAGYVRNRPTGFAASVAMKGLVLRLYEYNELLDSHLLPKLIELANARGVTFDRSTVKTARDEWKTEFKRVKGWSSLRNQAAGHYSRDLKKQVSLLKRLDPDDVMHVCIAFFSFNMTLLKCLREAGRGLGSHA